MIFDLFLILIIGLAITLLLIYVYFLSERVNKLSEYLDTALEINKKLQKHNKDILAMMESQNDTASKVLDYNTNLVKCNDSIIKSNKNLSKLVNELTKEIHIIKIDMENYYDR